MWRDPVAIRSATERGAELWFPLEKLVSLYKTHGGYVKKAAKRTELLEAQGWLLPDDAEELRAEAGQFDGL